MPSLVREIGAERPVLSRAPRDDEKYVMERFSQHALRCPACSRPYETFCSGRPLCSRGNLYATSLLQYVYQKCGKPYSLVDREYGRYIQVQIPSDCQVVHDLLNALDKGLIIPTRRQTAPVVVHNPKPVAEPVQEQPRVVHRRTIPTTVTPHSSLNLSRNGLYVYRRGTLYSLDLSRQTSPASSQRVRIPNTYLR
ncbi:hypothetical protein RJZ56_000457 [Blastomyces dermatitidis]|uniref:Uncharacterized protein n=3 Tax=Blastomyces TaxID=229219 RepID=A0A179UEV3_BLAGS|nr:uncharacterized protein BDBG_02148 [Blastomyces gilchristii SLH14081]XP_045275455.1 uncharacterized protein BDCG_03418 [Blastomyces dermatitidis ER-3]EGE77537.1 hypothetical protein BDDG_00474 [Blastomyces dermatitidis ATCC 18188]EQL33623.1 hypothetical protein BDFG_04368 [Blastomyces dermatitidis ATCC 26199]EEQ88298.1 hypothetical protein BDCG_03418 [Blastomyces dermatitidis ER-3]OAT05818.1 hypothetical protein BDBG_02148 [Blastomyces gilchristii SLH14081]